MRLAAKIAAALAALAVAQSAGFALLFAGGVAEGTATYFEALEEAAPAALFEACARAGPSWRTELAPFGSLRRAEASRVAGLAAGDYRRVGFNPARFLWATGAPGCAALEVEPATIPGFERRPFGARQLIRIALSLACVAAVWLCVSVPFVRRLARSTAEAERVVADEFRGEVDPGSDDELGRLVRVFNQASRSARRELDARAERERRLLEAMRTFSHEFRTPLCAAKLALGELALESSALGAQLDHLESLLANITALARLEGAELEAPRRETDLEELLERVGARLEPLARRAGVELSWAAATGPAPRALVDPLGIEQALGNIALNAIQHAHKRAAITLHEAPGDRGYRFEVIDDGKAGGARDLGDLLPSRGAGLRIARAVADAHGGEVRIEREGDRTRASLTLASGGARRAARS